MSEEAALTISWVIMGSTLILAFGVLMAFLVSSRKSEQNDDVATTTKP